MELLDAIPRKLKAKTLPWQEITIMPIGDFQAGTPGFDADRLVKHVAWGVKHGAFFLGTGDYTDIMSPSNRRYYKNAGLYDTARMAIEQWHRNHMDSIKEILEPTKGMWIGLHEGHHFLEYDDGTTSDTDLAQFLDAPFLGTAALTRLTFKDHHSHIVDCHLWSHHGEGGGQDPLGRLLKVAPGFPQVDIFVQGHNTQLGSKKLDVLEFYGGPGNLKMRQRTQLYVAAGGFMKGYAMNSIIAGRAQGSYVEKGMMRPTSIGGPLITVTPRRREDYNDLSLFCSI